MRERLFITSKTRKISELLKILWLFGEKYGYPSSICYNIKKCYDELQITSQEQSLLSELIYNEIRKDGATEYDISFPYAWELGLIQPRQAFLLRLIEQEEAKEKNNKRTTKKDKPL